MKLPQEDYAGSEDQHAQSPFKRKLFVIIFGTNTPLGKLFDILLILLILLSVVSVMLESVSFIKEKYGNALYTLEWAITIAFTLEYAARIWVITTPKKYIFSFFGIIDLLSIIPTYLSLILVGAQSLTILRAIRLLRIFRILKLVQFVSEAGLLLRALKKSRHKIIVFFFSVLILVFILGSMMYLIEGPENGFKSIPLSIYWAIVTLTTVGFGDITPHTIPGQLLASVIMLIGYSIIAIPTGIVGAEIYSEVGNQRNQEIQSPLICPSCGEESHTDSPNFCHHCGKAL